MSKNAIIFHFWSLTSSKDWFADINCPSNRVIQSQINDSIKYNINDLWCEGA
jgi:hypothetical protein